MFAWAIALGDSYASRPCVRSSPFERVEMDRIVSGNRGWGDTRVNGICLVGRSPLLEKSERRSRNFSIALRGVCCEGTGERSR
ncbi:hypothetical protein QUB70_03610 [Microcoleus sp. A003_D6]|uniref:hypothetical protein n=1 Tax=Microcoleus sp. A003_D6 TaxID=3055266 RepID=UPI002FD18D95